MSAPGYHFRPAITSEAKPLIGLYAESGNGKTYSSLLLAKGFAGDMSKVGMIETESGRGEVFADDPVVGGYQVLPIRDDFSPKNYGAAITAAGQAGLKVLIIDSASHEWEGAGGVLAMAAQNQEAGKKGPIVWQQPKLLHQREFVLKLLGTPVPLVIVCMRAKFPMKEIEIRGKKEWSRSEVLEPKQSEDILFEMMVHAWIDKEHCLHVTKYTKKETFQSIFVEGQPISVETGRKLAAWSAGITAPARITRDQQKEIVAAMGQDVKPADLLAHFGVKSSGEILAVRFADVLNWIQSQKATHSTCPLCTGELLNGKCHNAKCDLGEPPEEE